jgi:hypothetical protein
MVRKSHSVSIESDDCASLSLNAGDGVSGSPAGEGGERSDDIVVASDLSPNM